ncbi:MAG: glycosyl hydrolase [Roseburia sp.]|nr:glycosyl hydrolase [Roseburia sp.]MCM1420953.1 glycosyl hydrolase [Bacteroides sp.]
MSKRVVAGCVLMMAFNAAQYAQERKVEVQSVLSTSIKLDTPIDMHLTDAGCPIVGEATINLNSEDSWLFFDNMKPNEVLGKLNDNILINGKPLDLDTNARLAIYRQGAIVIPHSPDYCPLTTFTKPEFKGSKEQYLCNKFYTNSAPEYAPEEWVLPLQNDNSIRSFRLKRGYMATLANDPDGMGYSRIFIADTADIELAELPELLDGKVSYIRVMRWQYVSKKGWAGSVWNAMPEGLKYVGEQSDFTNSTWFYNWSSTTDWTSNPNAARKSYNQEFVPEKWGLGGDFSEPYKLEDVTHLLGFNEPDHSEQSNISVEKAIEEWPILQKTGLRLGSPATTDFNWLYSFMSEAKKRNYRVDYVVVHAYWGGLSGEEWYSQLKEVHERTGRPIWIKEWNNGANWTHEGWPSGTEAQQEKQLRDLKNILAVMDTASFIERYSIYNWVEDKRAIILPNAKLTPAGEYYRDNNPEYFFSHDNEVVPVWTVRTAPALSYKGITENGDVMLEWSDENVELIDHYIIEYSETSDFRNAAIADVLKNEGLWNKMAVDYLLPATSFSGKGSYLRVRSVSVTGTEKISNVINVNCVANEADKVFFDEMIVTENWRPIVFGNPYSEKPAAVLGVPTYRNKMPLSSRIKDVATNSLDFRLSTWEYQLAPSFANPDTIALAILPKKSEVAEVFDWNGVTAQTAVVENVGKQWQKVVFGKPFDTVPVVIPCQMTDNMTSATSVRIKNVTAEGFEVCLRFEGTLAQTYDAVSETISYLAVTPGKGNIDGRMIIVGETPDAAVSDNLLGGYEIDYSSAQFESVPLFFGAMQTEEDTITSTLRIKNRDCSSAVIFKDREKAVAHERVKPEKVGWMVVERTVAGGEVDAVSNIKCDKGNLSYNKSDYSIRLDGVTEKTYIQVFDLQGRIVVSSNNTVGLSLACLPHGVYVVKANGYGEMKVVR